MNKYCLFQDENTDTPTAILFKNKQDAIKHLLKHFKFIFKINKNEFICKRNSIIFYYNIEKKDI